MKTASLLFILSVVLTCGSFSMAKHFWRGQTISGNKIEEKWPDQKKFEAQSFRNGDSKVRSKMTKALASSKQFIGKSVSEIRAELGAWDGYYFSDAFPAYIIQDGRAEHTDTWQIVFLLDKNEKVSEIIVHKNCCG